MRTLLKVTCMGFATVALLLFIGTTVGAEEQRAGNTRRIGYLDQGSLARNKPYFEAFKQGLRRLGWVEGQNMLIETRFADGKTDRLPMLAAELVRLKMDLIVTWTTPAALAAKQATSTIPIVIGFCADPVGSKIVASVARPGGNITGWSHQGVELRGKYLELLKETIPGADRFGVLWNPTNQVHRASLKVIEAAAERLKVDLHLAPVQDPKDLANTFSALVGTHVDAIVVFPDGMFVAQTPQILALAARYRLPMMYGVREYAEAGGLMAYGANLADMHRELGAALVDKILRGAKPADLPIEQPNKFDLVINLKAAKLLGLSIPASVLARADAVIE